MTNQEYQVLSILASSGLSVPDPDPETLKALTALRAKGLVSCDITGDWYINDSGIAALAAHRELLENTAKQKAENDRKQEEARSYAAANNRKQFHHDYLVAAFQVFLSFALGLVAEHYLHIISLIVDLLEN